MTRRSWITDAGIAFLALVAVMLPLVSAQPGAASARVTAQPTTRTISGRTVGTTAQTAASPPMVQSAPAPIPAYHRALPKGPLPATLPAQGFTDPLTKKAYAVAAKLKPVLYQLPCYCGCDRAAGHTSLLSCYGDMHGSECEICKKEAFYAYEQNRKGKTAPQIRAGIVHGDWEKVDLAKYAPPLVSGGGSQK